jgi:hypothetical protein
VLHLISIVWPIWKVTLAAGSQTCTVSCLNAARCMLHRLATPSKWSVLNFKDTIAIHLHPDNREIGFPLSPGHEHNVRELKKTLYKRANERQYDFRWTDCSPCGSGWDRWQRHVWIWHTNTTNITSSLMIKTVSETLDTNFTLT